MFYKGAYVCTIKLTCTYSSVSKCFTFYHLNLQIVIEINWKNFFFQFQNFFSKTLFWVLFSGQNSSVQQWVWLGIDSYLVMFFSFFLDSEPESEDSYYGTPRNNNNKRRKSRGILKTTPSEYVFTFACIYSCLYEVSSYSTHHSRLTERFSFQSYLMLSCKNVALSQSPPPKKKEKFK